MILMIWSFRSETSHITVHQEFPNFFGQNDPKSVSLQTLHRRRDCRHDLRLQSKLWPYIQTYSLM